MRCALLFLICLMGLPKGIADSKLDPGTRLFSKGEWGRIMARFQELPSGEHLSGKALDFWGVGRIEKLRGNFAWHPDHSRTDAMIQRKIDPDGGKENRSREVQIYIKQNQSEEEILLDLSHELVHAVYPPEWDPYDPGLGAGQYIQTGIEGSGGEVHALWWECRLAFELQKRQDGLEIERCKRYEEWKDDPAEVKQMMKEDFYALGEHRDGFFKRLGTTETAFPFVSEKPVVLYSSTGKKPYPLALYEEYLALNEVACENSRDRIEAFKSSPRRPAAAALSELKGEAKDFLRKRCP